MAFFIGPESINMTAISLVHVTPNAERLIAYCARVSNPANQASEEFDRLLRYCVKHGHWSVFEMASMCVEIETSRAISAQIMRHRSFSFQEFSQRYAAQEAMPDVPDVRMQDPANRQSSHETDDEYTKDWWQKHCAEAYKAAYDIYKRALLMGVAKEVARMVLPMATPTRVYMHGTIRSWIHYLDVRTHEHTQKEHRDVADQIKGVFCCELPNIARALDWVRSDEGSQDPSPGPLGHP